MESNENEITTITILRKTHAELLAIGKKGESFDKIVARLLSKFKEGKQDG